MVKLHHTVACLLAFFGILNPLQASDPLSSLDPALFDGFGWTNASLMWRVTGQLDRLSDQLCCCEIPPCLRNDYDQFWIEGLYNNLNQGRLQNLQGFKGRSYGLIGGYDHDFCHFFKIGGVVGYAKSDVKWRDLFGRGHMRNTVLGTYAAYCKQHLKVKASALWGWQRYHTDRNILLTEISSVAEGRISGHSIDLHLAAEYKFHLRRCFELIPFGHVDYFNIRRNDFTERNGGIFNFFVNKTRNSFARTELGTAIARPIYFRWGALFPRAKVSWVWWDPISRNKITSHFINNPGSPTTVTTASRAINQVAAGVDLTLWTNDGISISGSYEGEFGGRIQDQEVNITLAWKI